MSRYGGDSPGESTDLRKPIVFGKNAYHLWIALCIMAGVWVIGVMLIWLISF